MPTQQKRIALPLTSDAFLSPLEDLEKAPITKPVTIKLNKFVTFQTGYESTSDSLSVDFTNQLVPTYKKLRFY